MDYQAALDKARKLGTIHPTFSTEHDAKEKPRFYVQTPEGFDEDMATLDAAEARLSAMVAEGVISGLEALRLARAIPKMRRKLKATRRVFRIRTKPRDAEED